jgi:integrase
VSKLFKRGDVWYARVFERGRWRRKSTNCSDKRAAERSLVELERDAADPALAASRKATTEGLLRSYLASRKRIGRSEGTQHHVRVKSTALVTLLPSQASDITHSALERYIDARLEQGVMRTTIKKELRVLKAALRLAKKNAEWTGDPADVIPELDDDHKDGTRALSPWELVALATVLKPRRMAHVAFAAATGCDPSAVFRARIGDVAADFSSVQIHGTKRKSRERRVPLAIEVQRSLLRWAIAHAPGTKDGFLFASWGNVRRDLHIACAKVHIPGCSPNDLRRTFGTHLRNAGAEPQHIGAAMGHADSRMTERVYGKLTPEALGKLLERSTREDPASGSLMGHDLAETVGTGGTSEGPTTLKPPVFACAGAESNRRHGDFQSISLDARFCNDNEHVGISATSRRDTNGICAAAVRAAPWRAFYCPLEGRHFDARRPVQGGPVDCPKCEAPARELGTAPPSLAAQMARAVL